MNDIQTPYKRYKSLLGYLSSSDTCKLADETIETMQLRIAELEDRVAGQLRALEVAGNYIEKLEDQIKILSELNVKYIELNEGAE